MLALLRAMGAEKLPGRLTSSTPPDPADVRQALAYVRSHVDTIEYDLAREPTP